jgi:hypothetical protein
MDSIKRTSLPLQQGPANWEVLPTESTYCLLTGCLQRDSSFLPVGTGPLYNTALLALLFLLDMHIAKKPNPKQELLI